MRVCSDRRAFIHAGSRVGPRLALVSCVRNEADHTSQGTDAMKLFISTALLACSFTSFVACDQTLQGVDRTDETGGISTVRSTAIEALEALGPERRIVPASIEETKRFEALSLESQELMDAKGRLGAEGFVFVSRATAFWTKGEGEPLATLVERGRRADEQVMLVTVWKGDLTLLSSFEVGGEGPGFEVHEVIESCEDEAEVESPGFTFVAEDTSDDELGMQEGALIGYVGGGSTQCTLQNGIIDAGGQVADGLCLGEANFVCFWQYIGNDRAFNRCVNQRVAACQIGTDKWSAPVCN